MLVRRIIRRLQWHLARGFLGRVAREAVALQPYTFGQPASRVQIAPTAVVNDALFNVVSGTITIGDYANFGHGVSLLTGTHDVTQTGKGRMNTMPTEGRDIEIGPGVWLASNVTVIGPCVIGADAVVCAGAVVTKDVAAGTTVAGIPARPLT